MSKPHNPYVHGISISSLQKWMVCRERYRLYSQERLIVRPEWDHKIAFGSFVGGALETYGASLPKLSPTKAKEKALGTIKKLVSGYSSQFLSDVRDIEHWGTLASVVFDEYLVHYASFYKHYTPYAQEYQIDYPILLGSGRSVHIHGYLDEIFKCNKTGRYLLVETKCRGRVDELETMMDLNLDLQTMTYFAAFRSSFKNHRDLRYNVIRRPAQRLKSRPKRETLNEFYARVRKEIKADPHHYFKPFNVTVSKPETSFFLTNILHPLLEDYLDWYDRIAKGDRSRHWIRPFGVYDTFSLGQRGDYYEYMTSQSKSSLVPVPKSTR